MSARADFAALLDAWRELHDLRAASALLSWDQETMMPSRGADGRASVLATVAGAAHDRLAAPRLGERLERLSAPAAARDLDADERAMVREAKRDHDRAAKLPRRLVTALAEAESKALAAWQRARAADSFADFVPSLTTLLALKTEYAHAIGFSGVPLDALLDDFEPGLTVAALEPLFAELRQGLAPLVAAIDPQAAAAAEEPLTRAYEVDAQRDFARSIAAAMGFDFAAGRLDRSAHPFCTGIHPGDVRLTWRGAAGDLRPALFGIIHEAGHGLYEQGLPDAFARTPLGEAASLGVHESQSRLWENVVARGRPFWRHWLPELKRRFAAAGDVTLDAMVRAVNAWRPSTIRVEADELTYDLHIVLRFEIERGLFGGSLAVADLPDAWNAGMARLLGVRPQRDAEGVLQDIHWSMGAFGYFPTYTLGNLYAAQLHERAVADLGGPAAFDARIERGDMTPLREWLREHVHRHGRRFRAAELIERATGSPPGAGPFLRRMTAKFQDLGEPGPR